MNLFKIKLFASALIFAQNSIGLTAVVKAPQANSVEYLSFVQSQKKYQLYSESSFESDFSKRDTEGLEKLFENAQRAFLSADVPKAKSLFRSIVEKKWLAHWNKEERKAIVYSHLRLAQLSDSLDNQRDHIVKAIHFDANIKINQGLLPPPIFLKWQSLKDSLPKTIWEPKPWIYKYSFLIINGQRFNIFPGVKIPLYNQSRFALSFYSSSYKSIHTVISDNDLFSYEPRPEPLVAGVCHRFKSSNLENPTHIYFTDNCVQPIFKTDYLDKKSIAKDTLEHIKRRDKNVLDTSFDKSTADAKPWYKSWKVWGFVAGSALVIYNSQQKSRSPNKKVVVVPSNN